MKPKKQKTWKRRFPDKYVAATLEEIAGSMGISHQAVQQSEASALKKVMRAFKRPELRDFIDF